MTFSKGLLSNSLPLGKNMRSNITKFPTPRNDLWSRAQTKIQISLPLGQQENSNALPSGQSDRSKSRPMPCLPARRLDIDRCIINTKKTAFATDGWGTALAKVTCAEMDSHIANSGKKNTKTANITRCLQDFEKPRLFWLMNTFTRSRLTKLKELFLLSREVLPQGQKN